MSKTRRATIGARRQSCTFTLVTTKRCSIVLPHHHHACLTGPLDCCWGPACLQHSDRSTEGSASFSTPPSPSPICAACPRYSITSLARCAPVLPFILFMLISRAICACISAQDRYRAPGQGRPERPRCPGMDGTHGAGAGRTGHDGLLLRSPRGGGPQRLRRGRQVVRVRVLLCRRRHSL